MTHVGSPPFGWVSRPLSAVNTLISTSGLEFTATLPLLKGNRFSFCQGGVITLNKRKSESS